MKQSPRNTVLDLPKAAQRPTFWKLTLSDESLQVSLAEYNKKGQVRTFLIF